MARKKATSSDGSGDHAGTAPQGGRAAGALMLLGEPAGAAGARTALSGACEVVIVLRKAAEALEASATCDVLVLCAAGDSPQLRETLESLHRQRPGVACVVWCDHPTIELASACLQLGAADLIDSQSPLDAVARLSKAAKRTRQWRAARRLRATRAKELRETSKQLATLQGELEKQVGAVAGQLAGSFRDVAGQLKYVAVATELETLLRQELEVEPLLRTTLEFLLRKIGAVNVAIFMPDDGGDYSLGAYVNYDFPRESAQATLEELGGAIAPVFEARGGLHVIEDAGAMPVRDDEELGSTGGPAMGWLRDATLAVFACKDQPKRHATDQAKDLAQNQASDGEGCTALIAIFRDKRTQFDATSLRLLTIIGEHFGQQLTRLVATTNRAAKHNRDTTWDARGEAA